MKYLLDTCVISELVTKNPNTRVVEWIKRQDPDSLYLSFVTIGEIKKGIAKRDGDARSVKLEKWLQTTILGVFGDRILPVERKVALEWGAHMRCFGTDWQKASSCRCSDRCNRNCP